MKFDGRVLVIGCGFVSRCTIPLILRHVDMPPQNITVIDLKDSRKSIEDAINKGVIFKIDSINKENFKRKLSSYVSEGDLVVDLAVNIASQDILEWCHFNKVMYINSSIEEWSTPSNEEEASLEYRTLYSRHMKITKMISKWDGGKGSTAVLEHGANPGLVSHFTKLGLKDIAEKIINEKNTDKRVLLLKEALKENDFAEIARLVGLKTIHISERDTQITNKPKKVNEFVNTWSVDGFYEEAIAPAELGWGTHESKCTCELNSFDEGACNAVYLSRMGMKTWVRSWVPSGEITGMVIRHGEAVTLSEYLTVWKDGKPVYRPTVNYAYCPCDSAANSLHELEMREFNLQEDQRILTDEIISGYDELGVLLMGHDFKSWWVGSILDIHEARQLAPHQNATTLQVACSVMAAMLWMIKNPRQGLCFPEDIPYEEVLSFAKQYLGKLVSMESDWTPLKNKVNFPGQGRNLNIKDKDIWNFGAFLIL